MREIHERYRFIADFDFSLPEFLMRQLQEIFQKPQVVHRFECRGMDCVAAKIAQKIRMLFKDDRIDAGAGKKKSEHHPGGSAANDTTTAGDYLRGFVHPTSQKKPVNARYAGSEGKKKAGGSASIPEVSASAR
jgi:hypothetical protein